MSSVKSVCSVREKPPQQVVCVLSHRVGAYYFSQKDTEEQNTQHSTETLSQPISQNLTAIFSYNVLWILYAGGVLWVRNVGWNVLLNLWVLWEKNLSTTLKCFLFLTEEHRRTEHTKAHKDSGPSPDPSPGGKGSDHRDTPIRRISALCCPLLVSTIVLKLCDVCMPEAFCELEMCAKRLSKLCALCERKKYPSRKKKLPSESHRHFLIERVHSFSHRRTQKNRTHSIPQRH